MERISGIKYLIRQTTSTSGTTSLLVPSSSGCPFRGDKLPQQSYPFSVGDRNCIGRSLALMEMPLFFAKLFSNFDVHLATDFNTVEDLYSHECNTGTAGMLSMHMRLTPWPCVVY